MPSSSNLSFGPGRIYVAPIGTAEPTDLATALAATWVEIGYTTEGSAINYEIASEPVDVAESLDPLFMRTTGRTGTMSFVMAENTVRNLTLAFNGGVVTTTGSGATQIYTYEPPEPGTEVRRMFVWVSQDGTERWIIRQAYQSGSVEVARRKGAAYASLPVEFSLEVPTTGKTPFKAIYAGTRAGGYTV